MAPAIIAPMSSTLVDAVIFASRSTHKSVTIQNEALTALDVLFKQVPYAASSEARSWLLPVVNYSINPISGLRARALQVIQTALMDLIKNHDKIGSILDEFMNTHFSDFVMNLNELLSSNEEIYVIQVWGAVVAFLGRKLHRTTVLNSLLKVMEKCFNTKKAEVRYAAFQSWKYLIYNFSLNGHLFHDKRIKLIMVPLLNCFNYEKNKNVKLSCLKTWTGLVYIFGDSLTKFFDKVFVPVIKFTLSDDAEDIRQLGFSIVDSLLSWEGRSPNTALPDPLTFVQMENITPDMISRKDPKWIRSHTKYFLDMLFVGLENQAKWNHSVEWIGSSLTDKNIIVKSINSVWIHLLHIMEVLLQKEVNPSSEGIQSVHQTLFFISQVSKVDNSCLISSSAMDTDQSNLDDQKLELVHYMIKGLLQSLTPRTLVLTKYRMSEEERKLSTIISENASSILGDKMCKQLSNSIMVTPIVFITKIWMSVFSHALSPQLTNTFWETYKHFIEISQNGPAVLDVFSSFFGLLSLPDTNVTLQKKDVLTAWSCIVKGLCYHIDESNAVTEDLNPFADDSHEVIYEAFMFPIRISCEHSIYLDIEHIALWKEMFDCFHRVIKAKSADKVFYIHHLVSQLWLQMEDPSFSSGSFGVVIMYVDITCHFLNTLSIENGIMTNTLPGVHLFRKTMPDNKHSAKELSPSQILGIICGILFQKLYESLDQTLPEPHNMVSLTEGLFSSIASTINRASKASYITVMDYLTQGFSKWLQDEGGHIRNQSTQNQQSYYKMIDTLWCAALERVNSLPDLTSQDAIFHLSALLIAGVNSKREQIKATSARFLKKVLDQCSPNDVPPSLQPLLRSNCLNLTVEAGMSDPICEKVEFRREVTPESPAIRPKPSTPKKKLASPAAIAEYNDSEGTPSHGARTNINQMEQFRREPEKSQLSKGKHSAIPTMSDVNSNGTPIYWKGKRKASTPFKSPTMGTPCAQDQSSLFMGGSHLDEDDEPETPTKRLRRVKISADTPANPDNASPLIVDKTPNPTRLPPPKFDLQELSAHRQAENHHIDKLLEYVNEVLESRDLLQDTPPSTLAQLHTKLNKLSETIVQTLAQKVLNSTP
ncbi:Translation machinery-associated protein 22, variant 2 [Basidiobolus ranarum]